MNWIDDKYKETLGNKKFPSNLKEAGWEKAQALLDSEFPVAKAAGGFIAGKYIIVAMALLIIPAAIWYFNSPTVLPAVSDSKPNEQVEPSLKNDPSNSISTIESESKSIKNAATINSLTDDGLNSSSQEEIAFKEAENNSEAVNPENQNPNAGLLSGTNDDASPNPSSPEEPDTEADGNGIENPNTDRPALEGGDMPDLNSGKPKPTDDKTPGEVNQNDHGNQDSKPDPFPGVEKEGTADKKPAEPDVKENDFQDKKPLIDGGFEEQSKPDPNEDAAVVDDTASLAKENDTIADKVNSNPDLAPLVNKTRKDHLAFADIPDLMAIGDYQLFSRERFSISIWGGYSYVDKFLTADNQSYVEKRKNEEKAIWASSSGFKIDYFLNNHWTFGFGLGYSEYGEDLNYNISQRDTFKIDGRNSNPANFSNIIQLDSARIITGINQGHWNYNIVTEDIDSAVLQNNRRTTWQYVEIPFTVGYRFGKGRIKPWLKTGLSFGIPVNSSFRYLNTEATNLNEIRLSKSEWVAPIQYNYLFEAGLDCFITRNFSVRVNATSSFQLNSSFQQSSDISQRYYRLGLNIGLAYNF